MSPVGGTSLYFCVSLIFVYALLESSEYNIPQNNNNKISKVIDRLKYLKYIPFQLNFMLCIIFFIKLILIHKQFIAHSGIANVLLSINK